MCPKVDQYFNKKQKNFPRYGPPINETSCSKSWVDCFKKRCHISSCKIHGEGASASVKTTKQWLDNVWPT